MNHHFNLYPKTYGLLTIKKNLQDYFIRDRNTKKDLIGNRDLVEILSLCNGRNSVQDIAYYISENRKEDYTQILEKTAWVLSRLVEDKLIHFAKEKSFVPIRIREYNFKFPLNFVYLEPTRRCNFKCIHCYAMSPSITRNSKENNEMNTKEYFRLIDKLDEIGVVGIYLTGGEVFIKNDILDILDYINSKNIEFGILSNGSLLNKDKITLLSAKS